MCGIGTALALAVSLAWGETGFLRVEPVRGMPRGGFCISLIGRGFTYTSDFDDSTYAGGGARLSFEYALMNRLSIKASLPVYLDMFGGETGFGMGDAEIGLKYSIADLVSIYPFLLTGTGSEEGLFRYWTTGSIDGGVEISFSHSFGKLGLTGKAGYIYHGVRRDPHNPDQFIGAIGLSFDLGMFQPFVEFAGWDRGGFDRDVVKIFGPDIAYLTPGVGINLSPNLSLVLALDIRLSNEMHPAIPWWGGAYLPSWENDFFVTAGPGKRQHAVNIGVTYTRREVVPKEATIVKGRVIDVETEEPLIADISFPDAEIEPLRTDEEGLFEISLVGEDIAITASKEGYRWMRKTVTLEPGTVVDILFALTPEKTIIKGKIVAEGTGEPILASVVVGDTSLTTDQDGLYAIEIEPGTYVLRAESDGYLPLEREVNIELGQTVEVNFSLASAFEIPQEGISVGEITGTRIRFKLNSAVLSREAKGLLDRVAITMNQNPKMRLEVQGHACELHTQNFNMALSRRRARAVRSYLIRKGVEKGNLEIKGFSETVPIDPGHTESARAKNRRVEFVLIEK